MWQAQSPRVLGGQHSAPETVAPARVEPNHCILHVQYGSADGRHRDARCDEQLEYQQLHDELMCIFEELS